MIMPLAVEKPSVFVVLLLCFWTVGFSESQVGQKALAACRNYAQSMLECQNVLHSENRVRVPIDLLLYPHMVLIGYINEKVIWKCGGSLINEEWVLTAAHCKEDALTGPAKVLRIGTATFEFDEVEELTQERNVSEFVNHPDYAPPSKYHDIALVKADRKFSLNRDIRIACLTPEKDYEHLNLTVIGFGTTVSGVATSSQTLMKVDVDLVPNEVCNKSMKSFIRQKVIAQGVTENQLCAGDYENGGRDTCQGDSGGPLQAMVDRVDCVKSFPLHIIVGVTSFGRDCGRKKAPGIYTRVSKYIEWIESVVWP